MTEKDYMAKNFKVVEDPDNYGYVTQVGECVEHKEYRGSVTLALKFNDGQILNYKLINLLMTGPGAGDGVLFPREIEKGKLICTTQVIVSLPTPVDKVDVILIKTAVSSFTTSRTVTWGK